MNSLIEQFTRGNFKTRTIGYTRTLLALSTLISILFNDLDIIFKKQIYFLNLFDLFNNYTISKIVSLIFLFITIIGYLPKLMCILHFWVANSFFEKIVYAEGGDQINLIITFLLIPILLNDSRKWHWKNDVILRKQTLAKKYFNVTNNFVYLLIRVQVATIYFISCISKPYKVEEWKDGTALYYWFNNSFYGYSGFIKNMLAPLIDVPIVLLLLTWGVLILELGLASCLFLPYKYRKYFLVPGLIFHLMIFLIHGLASFSITMSAALILYIGLESLGTKNKQSKISSFFTVK
ncbi:hypothetical protein [Winogradskyella sp.]|uniref:hypothetical protein n=1 Tax=Winogradskyella sp. TaxID=1883156 RepID=UPI00261248BE|nr:hypothetical protein [Winogradskyella sp.]